MSGRAGAAGPRRCPPGRVDQLVRDRDAVGVMSIVVTAAAALAAGYLLGRLRPWQRLGGWAADQIRFTGPRTRGGAGRRAVVVLAHAVTAPRTSWRVLRAPGRRDAGVGTRTRS